MRYRTLIGIVTFGNLPFTQITINEIKRTTKSPVDFCVVAGKPDDTETPAWLASQWRESQRRIKCIRHPQNWGMPYSVNDIYDDAFKGEGNKLPLRPRGGYDAVIFVGNDVVVYPGAIDAMIAEAKRGEFDWVCASEYDVRSLCRDYPEARAAFQGDNYQFTDFQSRPWDLHANKVPLLADPLTGVEANCRKDTYNLCLYTRRSFEQMGYMDVNFWPSGYFGDNDWGHRGDLAGVKACGLRQACYFHFWSRTIHQGTGTTARQFEASRDYYIHKWGGIPGHETYSTPFNAPGRPVNITTRQNEGEELKKWMTAK